MKKLKNYDSDRIPLIFKQLDNLAVDELPFSVPAVITILRNFVKYDGRSNAISFRESFTVFVDQSSGVLEVFRARKEGEQAILVKLFEVYPEDVELEFIEELFENFSTETYEFNNLSQVVENFVLLSYFNTFLSRVVSKGLIKAKLRFIGESQTPEFPANHLVHYRTNFKGQNKYNHALELLPIEFLIGYWIALYYANVSNASKEGGVYSPNYGFYDKYTFTVLSDLLGINKQKLLEISLILNQLSRNPSDENHNPTPTQMKEIEGILNLDTITLQGKDFSKIPDS